MSETVTEQQVSEADFVGHLPEIDGKYETRLEFFVRCDEQIPCIRKAVRFALGGPEKCADAELATSEMATNLLRHARFGWLVVAVAVRGGLACIMTIDFNTNPVKTAEATERLCQGVCESKDHTPLILDDDGASKNGEEIDLSTLDIGRLFESQRGLPLVNKLAGSDEDGHKYVGVTVEKDKKTMWAYVPLTPAPLQLVA